MTWICMWDCTWPLHCIYDGLAQNVDQFLFVHELHHFVWRPWQLVWRNTYLVIRTSSKSGKQVTMRCTEILVKLESTILGTCAYST
jgi:hypothetical protein